MDVIIWTVGVIGISFHGSWSWVVVSRYEDTGTWYPCRGGSIPPVLIEVMWDHAMWHCGMFFLWIAVRGLWHFVECGTIQRGSTSEANTPPVLMYTCATLWNAWICHLEKLSLKWDTVYYRTRWCCGMWVFGTWNYFALHATVSPRKDMRHILDRERYRGMWFFGTWEKINSMIYHHIISGYFLPLATT